MGFILTDPKSSVNLSTLRQTVATLGHSYRDHIQFLFSDYNQAGLERMLTDSGYDASDLPAVVLLSLDQDDELFPNGPIAASLIDDENDPATLLRRFLGDILLIG